MTDFGQWDDRADHVVRWYRSLKWWLQSLVAFGLGFVTCGFFGVVF